MVITLSQRTLSEAQKVITGNPVGSLEKPISPYRSGPALVSFFNEFGFSDHYSKSGGFPSRWQYAEERLTQMNGSETLAKAIEAAVAPLRFLDTEFAVDVAVDHLNRYLSYDGCELVMVGAVYRVRARGEPLIEVEAQLQPKVHAGHEFIAEQIEKCDRKLREEDYDGAITNARSAIEAVLSDIQARLALTPPQYDGDLPKLYKRVQKLLNLDPERPDVAESLRQLLRGLANIVSGIAPLRNKMGDAHVRTYKPARHHAKLAVNAAKTFLDFIYDTFEYQKASGRLVELR